MDPIKAKIIELCPDVMELKHGCYFKWNYDVWFVDSERCEDGMIFAYSCTGDKHSWPMEMGEGPHWRYKNKHFKKEEFVAEPEYFEILGSPITLVVVLRAISKNTTIYGNLPVKMQLENIQKKYGEVAGHWNLEKDRWEDQTRETQLFIGSLLGVEK